MDKSSETATIYKLALAGEEAGFSIEEMIHLLNSGITVETLLNLIELRLAPEQKHAQAHAAARGSRWVM